MKGSLYLNGLVSAEGVIFPKYIEGNLALNGLISSKGLELPEIIEGSIFLRSLIDIDELILPKKIWDIHFSNLKDLSKLVLPSDFECNYIRIKNRYIKPKDFYKYQKQDLVEESQSKGKK